MGKDFERWIEDERKISQTAARQPPESCGSKRVDAERTGLQRVRTGQQSGVF